MTASSVAVPTRRGESGAPAGSLSGQGFGIDDRAFGNVDAQRTVPPDSDLLNRVDTELVDRVRRRLAELDTVITPAIVAEAVRSEATGMLGDTEVLYALRLLRDELVGAGPLEGLLRQPDVTDVLVTGPAEVWVDRGAGLNRTPIRFADESALRRLAHRLAVAAGRRLDDAQPFVDAWLPTTLGIGDVRLHAVIPPVAACGTCLSLRVLRPAVHDLATLGAMGTFAAEAEGLLRAVIAARLAFLVVGGTGSGKSTLLAALLGVVCDAERIVCVEDAGELRPLHPHFVSLLARPPNVEGAGAVTLRDLVRQALRMRPDRLVVGEVRGSEICDLLAAFNTGHDGGAGTLHANSPAEVPARMEALAALGGLDRAALHSQLSAAVQVVLHMARGPAGSRRLESIGLLQRDGEHVRVVDAWRRDGEPAPGRTALYRLLHTRGVQPPW